MKIFGVLLLAATMSTTGMAGRKERLPGKNSGLKNQVQHVI